MVLRRGSWLQGEEDEGVEVSLHDPPTEWSDCCGGSSSLFASPHASAILKVRRWERILVIFTIPLSRTDYGEEGQIQPFVRFFLKTIKGVEQGERRGKIWGMVYDEKGTMETYCNDKGLEITYTRP